MLVEPWLVRAARARPDHEALRTPQGSLSYTELLEAARRAAGALAPGMVAAIALPPGRDFAVALHACLLAGAVAVPVDARLGEAERARILEGCDCTIGDGALSCTAADPRPHDLDAPAIVVFTSGSSGTPKRVDLTYGNWLWSALGAHTAMGLRPDERWLCALPLSHVGGLSILVRSVIYGTTAIIHERFDVDAVRAEDATVVSLVPTTLARLLDAGWRQPPALRCALIGGAPIPPALLERATEAGVRTAQTYGLTEACSQVTTEGRPLFCTTVDLAPDGEILVRGPTVAPRSRAHAADGGGSAVLRTGDLGAFDDEGRLVVTGRKADTIVSGGENVAPAEIEAVLAEHPAVAEAAVFGRPDPEWGEAVMARVVLRDGGGGASEDELRAHCRARLAAFKVPKAIAFAADLPRTASGKLIRGALR